ncbi:diguanylate cyclase [Roseovarius aestuarii]|uniref:diguanylate cyclase n=1 Tax=Roseovarius aestuarii TaxID=475083 RepID=A0A1X7BLA0_9RHOB|nr:diguanylate cyclase [Roseovarius aestuarii]SMC10422.1 Diguanylate cyclase DosC [Roseovarius aestuarii]
MADGNALQNVSADIQSPLLDSELAMNILNSMEQGVLVWSADERCIMHNDRVFAVMEIGRDELYPGRRRRNFLKAAVARGELSQERVDQVEAHFASGAPFEFDRTLPSGRVVATNARPLPDGGHVVTFTDVSQSRRAAADLAEAKQRAETAETQALNALQETQARQEEATLLAELDEWLQCCKSLEELFEIVVTFISKLLPGSIGELYLYSNSRDVLDGVCDWGTSGLHDHIAPDSCWALRRGRHYRYDMQRIAFSCHHVKEQAGGSDARDYLCIPIVAHGDTVGLLHVRFDQAADRKSMNDAQHFAVQCGEHISLAIANVRLRDELHDQSTRDPLTGLYNRRYFLEALRTELAMAQRKDSTFALLSFDADRFKAFNDNHGHDAGDMVLRAIAECMYDKFGEGQVPCRFGGEEFTVLLPGATLSEATQAGEALRAAVEDIQVRYGSGALPRVTISVGVAAFPDHGPLPQDLLSAADEALYRSKDDGRNCVTVATSRHA